MVSRPGRRAQDAATTEDGAYTFSGLASVGARNSGALVFLPSEDEWYKAAYYDPDKSGGAGYYLYPTGVDSPEPGRDLTEATNSGNNVNYRPSGATPYPIDSPYYTTLVGEFELSDSPYGTFDQGGNVWEWNEALIGSSRGLRGGSFGDSAPWLRAASRTALVPATEAGHIGIRVASIPEPSTAVLLVSGLLCGLWWWRRAR